MYMSLFNKTKKYLTAICASVLCATCVPFSAIADGYDKYDVNHDGSVDKYDLVLVSLGCGNDSIAYTSYIYNDNGETEPVITSEYIGYNDELDALVKENADFNNDGLVTDLDYFILAEHLFETGAFVSDLNRDGLFSIDDLNLLLQYSGRTDGKTLSELESLAADNSDYAYIKQCGSYSSGDIVSFWDVYLLIRHFISSHKLGDVNTDGVVDSRDASLILSYYVSVQTNYASFDLSSDEINLIKMLGDVNGDNKITAVDASIILSDYTENQTY